MGRVAGPRDAPRRYAAKIVTWNRFPFVIGMQHFVTKSHERSWCTYPHSCQTRLVFFYVVSHLE